MRGSTQKKQTETIQLNDSIRLLKLLVIWKRKREATKA